MLTLSSSAHCPPLLVPLLLFLLQHVVGSVITVRRRKQIDGINKHEGTSPRSLFIAPIFQMLGNVSEMLSGSGGSGSLFLSPAPSVWVPMVPRYGPRLTLGISGSSHLEASLRAQQQTCQACTSFSRTCQSALPQSLAKFPCRRGRQETRGVQRGAWSEDLQGRARPDVLGFPQPGCGQAVRTARNILKESEDRQDY